MAQLPFLVRFVRKTFPQVTIIARLTKVPLLGRVLDYMLFDGDEIIYLPKDEVIEINQPVERHGELVVPSQILEQLVKEAGTRFIMNFCICRESKGCQDFPKDLGCLFLGDQVKKIDPRLGTEVNETQALEHLKKCREAGLVHLTGRNKIDTVWLRAGPGGPKQKFLTICNCCPCCCLWRILPVVSSRVSSKVSKIPGIVIEVTDKCIGCGTCTKDICFVNAIQLKDDKAVISDACRGCGRCINVCPQSAIKLRVEDSEFLEVSLEKVRQLVDIS